MPKLNKNTPTGDYNGNAIKAMALSPDVKAKSELSFGKEVARAIQSTMGGNTSYYFIRNQRFAKNRSMIAGRYDMTRFMDRLQMNGKFNYVNINWLPFHLVNTIVSRKVGAWMGRNEKIQVSAIDAESEKVKMKQYEDVEFYLEQKEKLEQLQQASGIPMIPQGNLPKDKDELDIWAKENNHTAAEIKYETGTNGLLSQEGLFDVVKEMLLHDSAGVGLVGLFTYMDEKGVIHNEYIKPENAIFSYSMFNDFRDTRWRGRIVSKKISDIRFKYGKEMNPTKPNALTEEQLFELSQKCKEYQVPDKISWTSEWTYALLRPYDEWNIDCLEFAYKSLDSDGFKMKVTQSGTLIMDKAAKKFDASENKEYIPDDGWNMYWGVYIKDADQMLEWGLMENQIKAQDIKEIGNVEFPFSFYMYQNQDMRNVAIPEKVEKPFEQMTLILLQMEKLITTWKPPGAKVNVNSIRELDLGTANLYKPLDLEKHYRQTGIYYYTDRDAEDNIIGDPITEIANAGFAENAQGLMQMYQFWYQTLKDELGEDPNLAQQASTPRVTEGNIQTSIQQADNATDYMYDAYLYVMEEAARKTACLMHDSVSFGAKVYNHIIGEDEVENRVFATKVRMLPTEKEIAVLEGMLNQSIATNKDLVMYINPSKILRIAKEDVKLAEDYYYLGMKRMLQSQISQAQQNQEATFKAQYESAKQKGEMDLENLKEELKLKSDADKETNKNKLKEIALTGVFQVMSSKEGNVQPEWKPVMQELIHNIMLPLFADNLSHTQALGRLIGQDAMQQGMEQEQPEQTGEQPQPNQSQPPQQMVA